MDTRPIGIFDSGVGGTSIWKELRRLMPGEDTIYLADGKNAPYGNKPPEAILAMSIKNTELLLQKGCKLIVVACNTATTNAIDHLRDTYGPPFIGIEPAIKPAALRSRTKAIGVLATQGTLSSRLFHHTAELHAQGIKVVEQDGAGLVALIEAGKAVSTESETLLARYLAPMLAAKIDHLVLGCTHYPFLRPVLQKLLPPHVGIIDSGEAVARQTKAVLDGTTSANRNDRAGNAIFYTNADVAILRSFLPESAADHVSYLDF